MNAYRNIRPRSVIVVIAVLLIIAIIGISPSAQAQPAHIPHQNPALVKENNDLTSVLAFWAVVLDKAATRRYQSAEDMLQQLKQYASVSRELQEMFNHYNSLTSAMVGSLDKLDGDLNQASRMLTRQQIEEAIRLLITAQDDVGNSRMLIKELSAATGILGDKFGVARAGPGSYLGQSYTRLTQNVSRLAQLVESLELTRVKMLTTSEPPLENIYIYRSSLSFTAPLNGVPGRSITISGNITTEGEPIDRPINVLLDSVNITTIIASSNFTVNITIPGKISSGAHSFTLSAPAVQRYYPATLSRRIDIARLPVTVEMQTPVFSIQPGDITVRGAVTDNGTPVPGAGLTIGFRGQEFKSATDADGTFSESIKVTLDASLIGPQEIELLVQPAQPWYSTVTMRRWVLVMNPAAFAILLLVISVGMVMVKRARRHARRRQSVPALSIQPGEEILLPGLALPVPLSGNPAKVTSAYRSALMRVVKATGVKVLPAHTLREILRSAELALTGTLPAFQELTILTEQALYSGQPVSKDTARRAVELADRVGKELTGHA